MSLTKNFLLVLLISILGAVSSVNNSALATELKLAQLARVSVETYLQGKTLNFKDIKLTNMPDYRVVGVFVTILDRQNKSRGCWGDLHPQTDLKESVAQSAVGALKRDYRYVPPGLSELPELKFQVSLVTDIIPVSSVREVNPLRDGLLVQSGGKGGILMPGEAVDAHYQMVQCKMKAGIQPGEPCNMFKLITRTYKE